MKTSKKISNCWKLIGGGCVASGILASALSASCLYNNELTPKSNPIISTDTSSTAQNDKEVWTATTTITAEAAVFFNAVGATTDTVVTLTLRTSEENNYLSIDTVDWNGTIPTEVTIPDSYNYQGTDYYVRWITGSMGFGSQETLTTINFNCTKLYSIGNRAFEDCRGLNSIDLSNCHDLTTIHSFAFSYARMNDINLTNCTALTCIDSHAFYYCGLKTINLSCCTALKEIKDYAFYYADKLTSIDLSGLTNLSDIGDVAFSACRSATCIDLTGCTNLTSIGANAFSSDASATTIDLSNCFSLETINTSAFYYCSGATSINLSGCTALNNIGEMSFSYCCGSNLTIDFTGCTELKTINKSAFVGCSGSNLTIDFNGCISLEEIGDYAFMSCTGTNFSVNLLGCIALKRIGSMAFYQATNFSEITFGANNPNDIYNLITNINNNWLQYLSGTITVNVPRGTQAEYEADYNALPNKWAMTPSFVEYDSFPCDVNDYFTCYDTNGNVLTNPLNGMVNVSYDGIETNVPIEWGTNINVKDGYQISKMVMKNTISNSDGSINLSLIGINNPNEYICTTNISTFEFGQNVTAIGNNAFDGWTGLNGLIFTNGEVTITSDSFSGCSNVKSVDFTNLVNIPIWGDGIFSDFPLDAEYLIPENSPAAVQGTWQQKITSWTGKTTPSVDVDTLATNYATGATIAGNCKVKVNDSTGLSLSLIDGTDIIAKNMVIKNDVNITSIGDSAFNNNTKLTGFINIPSTITTIGASVFNGCSGLDQIDLNWDPSLFSKENSININPTWLGELNKSSLTILVPTGTVDAYQAKAAELGINNCTITDGSTNPSDNSDNNLALGLGLGLGLGVPLVGTTSGCIALGIKKKK